MKWNVREGNSPALTLCSEIKVERRKRRRKATDYDQKSHYVHENTYHKYITIA